MTKIFNITPLCNWSSEPPKVDFLVLLSAISYRSANNKYYFLFAM